MAFNLVEACFGGYVINDSEATAELGDPLTAGARRTGCCGISGCGQIA